MTKIVAMNTITPPMQIQYHSYHAPGAAAAAALIAPSASSSGAGGVTWFASACWYAAMHQH
jgi:hypothetical protein